MDSTTTSSITDDQELAKVLENMNQQASGVVPPLGPVDDSTATDAAVPSTDTPSGDDALAAAPVVDTPSTPVVSSATSGSSELDSIKKTALEELRPLVDKLDLPADEKFDTLLLLIRSTDDRTLVAAAHEAARAITDETKRAQALLDVIKEIDYFAAQK